MEVNLKISEIKNKNFLKKNNIDYLIVEKDFFIDYLIAMIFYQMN